MQKLKSKLPQNKERMTKLINNYVSNWSNNQIALKYYIKLANQINQKYMKNLKNCFQKDVKISDYKALLIDSKIVQQVKEQYTKSFKEALNENKLEHNDHPINKENYLNHLSWMNLNLNKYYIDKIRKRINYYNKSHHNNLPSLNYYSYNSNQANFHKTLSEMYKLKKGTQCENQVYKQLTTNTDYRFLQNVNLSFPVSNTNSSHQQLELADINPKQVSTQTGTRKDTKLVNNDQIDIFSINPYGIFVFEVKNHRNPNYEINKVITQLGLHAKAIQYNLPIIPQALIHKILVVPNPEKITIRNKQILNQNHIILTSTDKCNNIIKIKVVHKPKQIPLMSLRNKVLTNHQIEFLLNSLNTNNDVKFRLNILKNSQSFGKVIKNVAEYKRTLIKIAKLLDTLKKQNKRQIKVNNNNLHSLFSI